MYSKKLFLILLLVPISAAAGCSSALYVPERTDANQNVSLAELQKGRESYIEKCGSCHNLYLPEKYTTEEWEYWTGKMNSKAKLTENEKSSILKYLTKRARK